MPDQSSTTLTTIDEYEKALANITSIKDARKLVSVLRGLAVAADREYKAAQTLPEGKEVRDDTYYAAVKVGELRLKAEARLGELIKQGQEVGKLATSGGKRGYTGDTTLKEYGLTKMDSSRAQKVFEHQDLIPVVVAKAIEAADTPTRRDLEVLLRLVENEAVEQQKVQRPMPPGEYSILLVDPPWEPDFSPSSYRRVQRHYPTLTLDELKERKIPSAKDAMLFLWTPAPMLKQALELMEAWGFEYRTNAVWDKEVIGAGYYFRNQHELLLLGKRGEFRAPEPASRHSSVIRVKRTNHSKKPEDVYQIIERMYPGERYIELFARNEREGWNSWGNEP